MYFPNLELRSYLHEIPTKFKDNEGEGRERGGPLEKEKDQIRNEVWSSLEKEGAALFPGAGGRIPNFKGAAEAAHLVAGLREWQDAKFIKANPDSPQRPVRYLALSSGKTVFMAVPRLREKKCFIRLDPRKIPQGKVREASSIKGAFQYGIPVHPREIPDIDLILCGSVAVNRKGARIGKGGGYSDLEFAIGREFGIVREDCPIVTTVHALQILDEDFPETGHDFRVDYIVTPLEVIAIKRKAGRPKGIIREQLSQDKIGKIPVLRELFEG